MPNLNKVRSDKPHKINGESYYVSNQTIDINSSIQSFNIKILLPDGQEDIWPKIIDIFNFLLYQILSSSKHFPVIMPPKYNFGEPKSNEIHTEALEILIEKFRELQSKNIDLTGVANDCIRIAEQFKHNLIQFGNINPLATSSNSPTLTFNSGSADSRKSTPTQESSSDLQPNMLSALYALLEKVSSLTFDGKIGADLLVGGQEIILSYSKEQMENRQPPQFILRNGSSEQIVNIPPAEIQAFNKIAAQGIKQAMAVLPIGDDIKFGIDINLLNFSFYARNNTIFFAVNKEMSDFQQPIAEISTTTPTTSNSPKRTKLG